MTFQGPLWGFSPSLPPSLPFGPFCVVLEDNPCFLSECPMFSHQCHYSLTTRWNGKQGWPVSLCVDVHMRPPAEMKAPATCEWREKRVSVCVCVCVCVCVVWIHQCCEDQSDIWTKEYLDRLKNAGVLTSTSIQGSMCECAWAVLCNKLILHVSLSDLPFIHINESAMC